MNGFMNTTESNALKGKTISYRMGAYSFDSGSDYTEVQEYCPKGAVISRSENVNLYINVYGSKAGFGSGETLLAGGSNTTFSVSTTKDYPYIRIVCTSRIGRGMTCAGVYITHK